MDRAKYQYEAMKWIVELELLNSPQVINTIKLNIFVVSKSIKEAELLIYRENKSMLVLLELSWFGRTFHKKQIFSEVQEALTLLLPSFRFRITDNPEIMNMAVEKVKKALTGGKNENNLNSDGLAIKLPNELSHSEVPVKSAETFDGSIDGNQPNKEKQSESVFSLPTETSSDDSKKE